GAEQPVDLDRSDELPEPLVQLDQQVAVERDAGVEQPMEGGARQAGDPAVTQRDGVVATRLLLEHRTLAEPAARRDAGEGDRLAANRHAADLDQALDDADPVVDRLALAAHEAS